MIELHSWPTPNGLKVSIFLEEAGLEQFEPLAAGPERYHTIHQLMDRLLAYLTRHRA